MDGCTKELLDADAIHPLSMASKMESEDYPSFKEILKMDTADRSKWFDSMDEELKVLFRKQSHGICKSRARCFLEKGNRKIDLGLQEETKTQWYRF